MPEHGHIQRKDTEAEAAEFISDRVKRGDYYFLDLSPDPARALSVVCGGREVCDSSYLVDRKDFRFYSLEFVASGSGRVSLGDRNHILRPGTVFCYGPGIPHYISADPASAMINYFVDFTGKETATLVKAAFPDGSPWAVSSAEWIQRLFEDLKSAADHLADSRTAVCALIVRQLLIMLADRTLSGTPGELDLITRFRNLKNRLRELALQGCTLGQAARDCGISSSYPSRLFRRFDTQTPQHWMTRSRMDFAASMLLDHQNVAVPSGGT